MGKVDHRDTQSAALTAEISLLQSKWKKKFNKCKEIIVNK